MKQYHTNIPASYLIPRRGDEVLLLLRENTGFEDGKYSLVSGHLEEGESFTDAMIREAKEEAGIIVSAKNLSVSHIMHRKGPDYSERVDAFFEVQDWEGEITNMEPHKCGGLDWFSLNSLPDNIIDYVAKALHHIKNNESYSEYGWHEGE